jgi:hypothetical protein
LECGQHLFGKRPEFLPQFRGELQWRGFVAFPEEIQVGDEIGPDAVSPKEFRCKKNHKSRGIWVGNDLVNLFGAYKKEMMGKDGIFPEIDDMLSGGCQWPYDGIVMMPVGIVGNTPQVLIDFLHGLHHERCRRIIVHELIGIDLLSKSRHGL